jgi:ACR3 family arsenite efflux pump ArsB
MVSDIFDGVFALRVVFFLIGQFCLDLAEPFDVVACLIFSLYYFILVYFEIFGVLFILLFDHSEQLPLLFSRFSNFEAEIISLIEGRLVFFLLVINDLLQLTNSDFI